MLERVRSKRNPPTLFAGMQVGVNTMENTMEVPQKMKIELPHDPVIPLLGISPDKTTT